MKRKGRTIIARLTAAAVLLGLCLGLTGCEFWSMPVGDFIDMVKDEAGQTADSVNQAVQQAAEDRNSMTVTLDENGQALLLDHKGLTVYIYKLAIEGIGVGSEQMTNFVVTVTNHTEREYDVWIERMAINGWMAELGLYYGVEPKETLTRDYQLRYTDYNYTNYDLAYCGITEITDAQFILRWGERDSLKEDEYRKVTLYANGATADTVNRTERRTKANETVLIDNEQFCLVVLDYGKYDTRYITDPQSFAGFYTGESNDEAYDVLAKTPQRICEMKAYLENRTGSMVLFTWETTAVNNLGLSETSISEMVIQPRTSGYVTLYFTLADLYRYGMMSIDKVTGKALFEQLTADAMEVKELVQSGSYSVYPTGLTDSTLPEYDRREEEYEIVEIDNGHCFLAVDTADDYRKNSYSFYVENRTNDTLYILQENISVNGSFFTPPEPIEVKPGESRYGSFPSMKPYAPKGTCSGWFDIIVTTDPTCSDPDAYHHEIECTFDY